MIRTAAVATAIALVTTSLLPAASSDADELLLERYIHGFPYDDMLRLDASDLPRMLEILGNDTLRPYWPNVVPAIGVVGEDRSSAILIDFLERRFTGGVDLDTFNALLMVGPALGYAAHSGDERAMQYLLNNASIEAWEAKSLGWGYGRYFRRKRSVLLTKMMIQGLVTSADPRAEALLRKMDTDPAAPFVELRRHCIHNIREGHQAIRRIRQVGLREAHRPATAEGPTDR